MKDEQTETAQLQEALSIHADRVVAALLAHPIIGGILNGNAVPPHDGVGLES